MGLRERKGEMKGWRGEGGKKRGSGRDEGREREWVSVKHARRIQTDVVHIFTCLFLSTSLST